MAERDRQAQVEVARVDDSDGQAGAGVADADDGEAEEYLASPRRPAPAKPLGVVVGTALLGLVLGMGRRRRTPGGGLAVATVPVRPQVDALDVRVRRRRGQR